MEVRHLLGHSSGIPDYLEVKAKGEKPLVDRVLEGGDMSWSIEDILETIQR